jgi:hypothetical protein
MKVLLKQIGSYWYSFLTVCCNRAMFGALNGDAQFPHQASDTFLTTQNSLCLQFSISLHTSIVLKSQLDLRCKDSIFSAVLTRFAFTPGIVPAHRNLKHTTHHRHWIVSAMLSKE